MYDLIRYGQEHLLAHWDTLTEDEKKNLYNEIKVKLTLFNLCSSFFLLEILHFFFHLSPGLSYVHLLRYKNLMDLTVNCSKKSAILFDIMCQDYSHKLCFF
jgi:hypothetical protein